MATKTPSWSKRLLLLQTKPLSELNVNVSAYSSTDQRDINLNPGPSTFKQQSCNKRANLKIGRLNVRSLKNRDRFLLVKDTILQNKFDVLTDTLSETWLNSSITNLELEIPGYNLYRIDRNTKTGGGVGVYVLQTYKVKVFDILSNNSDNGLHQLWINLQVRRKPQANYNLHNI